MWRPGWYVCDQVSATTQFFGISQNSVEFRENPVRKSNASLNTAGGLTITEVFTDRSGF